MHIAQKFETLLELYRHPDGRKWSGQEIDEATGGVVTRSYITNLRKGRIENPGYEKMRAIAKAMGFAPEVWFEDGLGERRSIGQAESSLLNEELVQALRDEDVRDITRESSRLPDRERRLVLGIVRQFREHFQEDGTERLELSST